MTAASRGLLLDRLSAHGIEVALEEIDRLSAYYDLLYKWNARINLTALPAGPAAIDKLLVEPVLAARWLPGEGSHLDIGSGGGSPALPIKALRPSFRSVLVESRAKKAAFLREAVRVMALDNVEVVGRRLSECVRPSVAYSIVTVRAVRMDAALLEDVERLASRGASLWYFGGPGDVPTMSGGRWNLLKTFDLLPDKQSRVMCFTWNTPADVPRGTPTDLIVDLVEPPE
jgi:16S rRNA (guanine527-N7)-methyltransferase